MNPSPLLALDWPAVAGGGFVAALLLGALTERLRRVFATREELTGLADRLDALQRLVLQTRETADEARDRARANQMEQKRQWERIAEQVIRPLERLTERLEGVGEAQAAQAAALDYLARRLDHTEAKQDAAPHPLPRRKP